MMMMKMKVKTISPLCNRTILISNPSWSLITVSVNSLFNSLNNPLTSQWYVYISSVTLCETCHTIVYVLFTAHVYLSKYFFHQCFTVCQLPPYPILISIIHIYFTYSLSSFKFHSKTKQNKNVFLGGKGGLLVVWTRLRVTWQKHNLWYGLNMNHFLGEFAIIGG